MQGDPNLKPWYLITWYSCWKKWIISRSIQEQCMINVVLGLKDPDGLSRSRSEKVSGRKNEPLYGKCPRICEDKWSPICEPAASVSCSHLNWPTCDRITNLVRRCVSRLLPNLLLIPTHVIFHNLNLTTSTIPPPQKVSPTDLLWIAPSCL